jgi:signal transduction histidine kinase
VSDGGQVGLDPLGSVQLVAIVDETMSALRHDLRNKLASVRNAEFYIRRRLRSSETWQADARLQEMSGIIQDEMRTANELLDQRARLQHLFASAPTRIDAAECVGRAVAWTRRPAECRVELTVEAEAGEVVADPSELTLAVRCLIENAVEALGRSGVVQVKASAQASRYVIQVEDAGAGIAESQRKAVFDAFFSTKPGHAGLGLSIARRIAERYDGAVVLRETATGTTIALELGLDAMTV